MKIVSLLLLLIPTLLAAQNYWQQDVHYTLDASLNTTDHTIHGAGSLVYKNNSPDILTTAYFHLYWNLFTKGSYGEDRDARLKGYQSDPTGGITLEAFTVAGKEGDISPRTVIDNTLMKVELPAPLAPGDSTVFRFRWTGHVPEGGERTGHQGRDYNIAQWYPQIAVYDRSGWDKSQYLGPAEFFLEYGTFDVSLTLPRSFLLGYSGKLLNPADVLSDSTRLRLRELQDSSGTLRIANYSAAEWDSTARASTATWKFHADNVRDFAWSANEHYIWDASLLPSTGDGQPVTINALYFTDKEQYWKRAAEYARQLVSFAGEHYGPYIWPNVFVVEGVVGGGMEYPGITFIGHYGDDESHWLFGVINHEVGHNWFPMMIGSNETAYAFMDEGFTTFLTARSVEAFYGRYNNSYEWKRWYQKLLGYAGDDERSGIQRGYFDIAESGYEEPIITHTYRFREPGLSGTSIYSKTAAVLYMLQYVLGDSVFDSAMKEYYRSWKLKHPYPEDFFAAISRASGRRDLNWFWDEWFRRTDRCDYGLTDFDSHRSAENGSGRWTTVIGIHKYQPAIMPLDVRLTLDDGTDTTVILPVDLWLNDEVQRYDTIECRAEATKAEINPDGRICDINRLNNVLPAPPVSFRFDNTMFSVTPVDAYAVKWRPSVWYTDEGGWNLGAKVSGSYLENLGQASVWGAYNFRTHTMDYDIGVTDRLYTLTPLGSVSAKFGQIEGRRIASLLLEKGIREHYSYPPYHMFRLRFATSRAQNSDFLLHPEYWPDGRVDRIVAGYEFNDRWESWSVNAFLNLESSTTLFGQSDYEYSKRTIDLRGRFELPAGWELRIRLYNGFGRGDIPPQSLYYAGNASPMDAMDDPLVRSKGVLPSEVRDHTILPGGGMMRALAGSPVAGAKIDAINAELRFADFIPFVMPDVPVLNYVTRKFNGVVFCDAGRIAGPDQRLWDERFELDCGVGFRLNSLYGLIGPAAYSDLLSGTGVRSLRVDFPFYTSAPPGDENKLKFRWVVSFRETF